MGQAKRRGTFEQRKTAAIARKTSQLVTSPTTQQSDYVPSSPAHHNLLVTQATVAGIMANGLAGKVK